MRALVTGAVLLLLAGLALVIPPLRHDLFRWSGLTPPHSPERGADRSLFTIVQAQRDYRDYDRDGNGKTDYWRGDIAGLYSIFPPSADERAAIKLIELSIAAADDRPRTDIARYIRTQPKAGYWYRSLRLPGETLPDPDRFAAACFPARYPDTGRWTFIVREDGVLWRKDLGHGRGLEEYPRDPSWEGWVSH